VSNNSKSKIYLHVPTFTLGEVTGDFIKFKWNNVIEESYFPLLEDWFYIGEL